MADVKRIDEIIKTMEQSDKVIALNRLHAEKRLSNRQLYFALHDPSKIDKALKDAFILEHQQHTYLDDLHSIVFLQTSEHNLNTQFDNLYALGHISEEDYRRETSDKKQIVFNGLQRYADDIISSNIAGHTRTFADYLDKRNRQSLVKSLHDFLPPEVYMETMLQIADNKKADIKKIIIAIRQGLQNKKDNRTFSYEQFNLDKKRERELASNPSISQSGMDALNKSRIRLTELIEKESNERNKQRLIAQLKLIEEQLKFSKRGLTLGHPDINGWDVIIIVRSHSSIQPSIKHEVTGVKTSTMLLAGVGNSALNSACENSDLFTTQIEGYVVDQPNLLEQDSGTILLGVKQFLREHPCVATDEAHVYRDLPGSCSQLNQFFYERNFVFFDEHEGEANSSRGFIIIIIKCKGKQIKITTPYKGKIDGAHFSITKTDLIKRARSLFRECNDRDQDIPIICGIVDFGCALFNKSVSAEQRAEMRNYSIFGGTK